MKALMILALATFILSPLAFAYSGEDFYGCVISAQDRINSKGAKLTTVRGILAQDRANYHKFKKRDAKDAGDSSFTNAEMRQLWQSSKVDIKPALAKRILAGGKVELTVFVFTKKHIEVTEGLPNPDVS